jgi:hypothetical protein
MKRVAVAALWLYSFWYLGSFASALVGVPDFLGPVFGLTAGLIVGIDPKRAFRRRSTRIATAAV